MTAIGKIIRGVTMLSNKATIGKRKQRNFSKELEDGLLKVVKSQRAFNICYSIERFI